MRRLAAVLLAAAAAVAASVPVPAAPAMPTRYRAVNAYAVWTTAPHRPARGHTYEDTGLAVYRVVSTTGADTTTQRFAFYNDYVYRIGRHGRRVVLSHTHGVARGANVTVDPNGLRSFAMSAQLRTRGCVLGEQCRGGRLDVTGFWEGNGARTVRWSGILTQLPGLPASRYRSIDRSREASVTMNPPARGHVEEAAIVIMTGQSTG